MPTKDACKQMLRTVGEKLGVSPLLISVNLLSAEDKQDMLDGKISLADLEATVRVWMENNFPKYTKASSEGK